MHKTGCAVCAIYASCAGTTAHRHNNRSTIKMTDFLDWNVKHKNKQTFFVSLIKVPVGMEGSSELLFACVKSNKLSRIYDWIYAKF